MFECCARDFGSNVDMDRSIGMFRTIYPVRLELVDHGDVRSSIINVKEHMKQVPNKGVGFGAIINTKNKEFPLVSFNYLGLFERENNENDYVDQWVLLDAFPQIDIDESTKERIKITAYIINKELRLHIKTKFGIERTCHFGKAFESNIQKIIQHTQSIDRTYLTRSDVNYVVKNEVSLQRIQSEKEVDAIFMANSLQQGLLYHSFKQSDVDDAYIVQSVFQYRTNIDLSALKMAWEHAQKRFSCLRLRFDWREELVQIIDKNQTLDWRFIDLSADENVSSQESELKRIQETDRNERFQLDIGNLFRIYLVRQKSDLFTLIFSFHHIILDGWSLPILLDYVHQQYLNHIEAKEHLIPVSFSISDESYAKAQLYLQNHRHDNVEFWENEISKINERCDLSGLLKEEHRNKVVLNEYDYVKQPKLKTLLISGYMYTNLKQTCRQNGVTLSSILQFVWHKILSVYGNSNETVTGTTVSGRNLPVDGIETAVGLFINTLPLIVNHSMYTSVIDGIQYIQDKMNETISRSNVEFSQLSKGIKKHSLFDCLFVYENYPHSDREGTANATLLQFEIKYSVEKLDFPLVVVANEIVDNESVTLVVNYAGELFEEETIDGLLDVANELLIQVGDDHSRNVSELHFLPQKQMNMMKVWSGMETHRVVYNIETTLHGLFEDEVVKSSEKVALVYEDVQLTYQELNDKANQLAHYIRSISDIRPDDLIALLLDKSDLMVISILGVWKSGAAYVPLDPSYPDERLQFILEDTKAKIVIANKNYETRLDSYNMLKIYIDCPLLNVSLTSIMNCNPGVRSNGHNLAYAIYTSGTTGKPKGVLVEHQSVVFHVNDLKYRYFGNGDNGVLAPAVLFFSNYVFDASIEQLTLGLLHSNKLIIVGNRFPLDNSSYDYLNQNRLTYLNATPSQIEQMDLTKLKYLQILNSSGEPLFRRLFDSMRATFKGRIVNTYGITETTISNLVYIYDRGMKYKNSLGCLLSHTKAFVLDRNMKMLPVHATGELYLTGNCMSRGYLNRPDLTAERFLPNPFQTKEEKKEGKNARIYKTGDIVRWLPEGELEYLGRNDFQVKIRGLRIELGEIEAILSSYMGVKRATVLAKEHKRKATDTSSTKYLIGYYVAESAMDENNLRQFIETKLPDYMIPNRLIRIDKIPVTINGKLDTKALPDIDFSVDEIHYVAPRNELESKLCEIWSDVLGIDKIGITDDFFRLGGDSIASLKVIVRVRQDHCLNVSVKDIFKFRTIEKLYDNIFKVQFMQSIATQQALDEAQLQKRSEDAFFNRLLPIQEYLINSRSFITKHSKQCAVFRIPRFDETRFKRCLAELNVHHEVFRIRFMKDANGKYASSYQTHIDSDGINIVQLTSSLPNEVEFETELNNILAQTTSIENGPMYMVAYACDTEDHVSAKVWIFMHDLIVDWTSLLIISHDLQRLYKGDSFRGVCSYNQWSNAYRIQVENIETSEMTYWESLLNINMKLFNATLVNKQPQYDSTSVTEMIFTAEITRGLLNDSNKIYNTQIEHLLLTGLGYTLHDEITDLKENYVMFECCARDFGSNVDMDRSIGMFRTIYPVRLELVDHGDVRSSIINVKEHMKQVPNKGVGFGAIINTKNKEFPLVSFNYLGLFERENNENDYVDQWVLLDAFPQIDIDESTKERIKITAYIINKELRLHIKTKFGIERTCHFGKAFESNIQKIIQHTQSIDRTYLTRSDVNYVVKNEVSLQRIQSEKEVDAIFMANSLQQGLLYHSFKQSDVDDAYIVQSVFQYRTNIDLSALKMAWEHAQKRFSCLRLRFDWREELVQIIDKNQTLDWRFIDLSADENVSSQESELKRIQETDRNERFQLDIGNLFRIYLVRQKSDLFTLIFSFHHIILDGWSLRVIRKRRIWKEKVEAFDKMH